MINITNIKAAVVAKASKKEVDTSAYGYLTSVEGTNSLKFSETALKSLNIPLALLSKTVSAYLAIFPEFDKTAEVSEDGKQPIRWCVAQITVPDEPAERKATLATTFKTLAYPAYRIAKFAAGPCSISSKTMSSIFNDLFTEGKAMLSPTDNPYIWELVLESTLKEASKEAVSDSPVDEGSQRESNTESPMSTTEPVVTSEETVMVADAPMNNVDEHLAKEYGVNDISTEG
jgi:hypothetical protein